MFSWLSRLTLKTLPIVVDEVMVAYQEAAELEREHIQVVALLIDLRDLILDQGRVVLDLLVLEAKHKLGYLRLLGHRSWVTVSLVLAGLWGVKDSKYSSILVRDVDGEYLMDLAELDSQAY